MLIHVSYYDRVLSIYLASINVKPLAGTDTCRITWISYQYTVKLGKKIPGKMLFQSNLKNSSPYDGLPWQSKEKNAYQRA
jgi:hypothetical protein